MMRQDGKFDAREAGEGQVPMAEIPVSSRLPGGRPLPGRLSRRWILRLVGAVALTVIGVLIAGGLAPFAIREQGSSGSVADTAATLTGEAQAASEGLRRIGYTCSEPTSREAS